MILLSLDLIESIDRLEGKIERLQHAKDLLTQDGQIPREILADITMPTNTSEAQRNAPAINYAGRDICPLCELELQPDHPHLVTTGGDCIKALKAKIT